MCTPYRITNKEDCFKNAKVKFIRDGMCRVTCFTRQIYKQDGFEKIDFITHEKKMNELAEAMKPKEQKSDLQRVRNDSFKRSKDKIFEIASANKWTYMVTFTLDKEKIDRFDREEVKKRFSAWLYDMSKRKGLKALIIPEYHKNGAIHFHGLINDSLDMEHSGTYKVKGDKKPIGLNTLKKRGKTPFDDDVQDVYNVTSFKLGFSTAIKLDGNVTAVAYYMTKYCTKDLEKIFGSYYFCVGKLTRSLPYQICNMDFERLKQVGNAVVVDLPDNFGQVCYATITIDDFEGSEIF